MAITVTVKPLDQEPFFRVAGLQAGQIYRHSDNQSIPENHAEVEKRFMPIHEHYALENNIANGSFLRTIDWTICVVIDAFNEDMPITYLDRLTMASKYGRHEFEEVREAITIEPAD